MVDGASRITVRRCACPCRAPLTGMRKDAIYLAPNHKAEGNRLLAQGLPSYFSPERFYAGLSSSPTHDYIWTGPARHRRTQAAETAAA